MNCPRCGEKAKATKKTWKYGPFNVEQYHCDKCDKKFNAYYKENKLSHTIPKSK